MLLLKTFLSRAALLASLAPVQASLSPKFHAELPSQKLGKRQVVFPAEVVDYKTMTTPTGVRIRYKEPGKQGVCETTPGVDSYSGYIEALLEIGFYGVGRLLDRTVPSVMLKARTTIQHNGPTKDVYQHGIIYIAFIMMGWI